jgi:outer membrane protein assembly factor BamB
MTIKRFTKILPVILVSLLLSACGSAVADGSWPGISVDEQNGNAYVAFGQAIYALQLDNGAERWHYPAERQANFNTFAPPQLTEDGQLLAAGYDPTLYSLDPANGNSNWTFAGATNRYIGSPLVTANGSYAPNSDGKLYALDSNGSLLWTFAAEQPLWSQPVMVGNVLVVSSMDHNVYGLDAQSGEEIWSSAAGGAIVSSPSVGEDGIIYVGTLNKQVLAINATNGREAWSFETPGWVWGSPTYFGGQLYLGDLEGTLIALDATTGRESWRVDTEGAITGAPLVVDDHIYVINENGQVISFALDGTIQWTKNIEAALYGSPIAAGDLILIGVGTADSVVTAFDQNGDTAWTFIPAATK